MPHEVEAVPEGEHEKHRAGEVMVLKRDARDEQPGDELRKIAEEAKTSPELVKSAPHDTPTGRVDDVLAAKHPVVTYYQNLEK